MDHLIENLTCNASYWGRDRYSGYEDEVFYPDDYEEYINIFDDEDERDGL